MKNLRKIFGCLHRLCLLELLVVELARRQVHLLAPEVFDTEAHSSQLNSVEFLDLVVKFALRVLQRTHNKPKSVDGLFLGVRVPVLDVKALCKIDTIITSV